ncbi:MAG: hypothetical protein H6566_06090 [Lewinellaceae bacterium]|nr:hypothetical protein [Lewinellaceae bacterium]
MKKSCPSGQKPIASWVKDKDPIFAAAITPVSDKDSDAQVITGWISTCLTKTRMENCPDCILVLGAGTPGNGGTDTGPSPKDDIDAFVPWAMEHLQLKAQYFQQNNIAEEKQTDFDLQNDVNFIPWLKKEISTVEPEPVFAARKSRILKHKVQYLYDNFNNLIIWHQVR